MANQPLILPQPPYQVPMTDQNGMISGPWNKWFQQLYLRVGGAATAPIANFNAQPLVNLISAVAPTVTQALYTAPVGQKAVLNSFQVQNTDFVARTISVWLVSQGLTPSSTNNVVSSLSIPAGTTVTIQTLQYQVVNGGGSIQIQGSASGVLVVSVNGRLSS